MEFEWDASNRRHIAEHGVTPQETEELIRNGPIDLERQNRNGEERTLQIGATKAGRILVVVSAFSGSKIRVITAWDAKENLARYWKGLQSRAKRKD